MSSKVYNDELKEKDNKINELEIEIMGLKEENKKYHNFFVKLIEDAEREIKEEELEMLLGEKEVLEKKVKAIEENLEKTIKL